MSRRNTERTPEERARRRNWAIVFILLGLLTIALFVVGTFVIIDSMNGKLHVQSGKPTATVAAAVPVDEEEAAKLAAEKATKGLTVGAVLTAEQAKAIAHYWQGNLLPYKMSDGSQVLIARDKPLPENVKADAGEALRATADAAAAAGDNAGSALVQTQKVLSSELGRKVTIVAYGYVALAPAFESYGRAWITDALGGDAQFSSAQEAADAARATVGPDATIIVGQ